MRCGLRLPTLTSGGVEAGCRAWSTAPTVAVVVLRTFSIQVGSGSPVVLIHRGGLGACSLVNRALNITALAEAALCVDAFDQQLIPCAELHLFDRCSTGCDGTRTTASNRISDFLSQA